MVVTGCVLWLLRHLGWLEGSGIARVGRWPIWLLGFVGLIYFTGASLCASYGTATFEFASLARHPAARAIAATHFAIALREETLFPRPAAPRSAPRMATDETRGC